MKNFVFLPLFLLGGAIVAQGQLDERQVYIQQFAALAVQEMERTNIPASIKLAQAILESRYGTSTLAKEGNNHFGIKCHNDWLGETLYLKDDDYVRGRRVKSCFRVYNNDLDSYIAHSEFLRRYERYSELFELDRTDYKRWAKGLQKAGYASSKRYSKSLIQLIEDLELYQFDQLTSNDFKPTFPIIPDLDEVVNGANSYLISHHNDVKYLLPQPGETLKELSKQVDYTLKELVKYNEHIFSENEPIPDGTRVYLQPKRKNYRGKERWHKVAVDELMVDIAYEYGLDLQKLYKRNLLKKGEEPATGAKIKLRGGKVKKRVPLKMIDFYP